MAGSASFRMTMVLVWLLTGVWFQSKGLLGESSRSTAQEINVSKEGTREDHDTEKDNSMEDLEIFYEYLDDSDTDFSESANSEKHPGELSPDYEEEFDVSQQKPNNAPSKECATDNSKDNTKRPIISTEDHISTVVTSDPNEITEWEDGKYMNLGLNPKIEISIEVLHEEITTRPQPIASSVTSADLYDKRPTAATRTTDSATITPKPTTVGNMGLLPFAIRALDKDLRPIENQDGSHAEVDVCERWLQCRGEKMLLEMARLQDLPNCPCMYSFDIHYKDEIWDSKKKHNYRWKDASGANDHLDIFHAGARWCIRSLISDGSSSSMAAQKCCYDNKRHLITRGNGAGTPYFISPEVSRELHHKVDVVPWIICKGDWTRYHIRRSPNNGMQCRKNPSDNVYFKQMQKAKNYR